MEEKDGIDEPKATRGSMDKPITFTSESTSLSTTGASISKEDLILYTEYTDHRAEEDYFMEEKDGIDEPKTNRDSMDTPITFTSESTSLSTTGAIISKEDLLLCAGYLDLRAEEDYFMEEKDGIDEPKTNRDSMDQPITFTSESTSLSITEASMSKEDLLLCAGYLALPPNPDVHMEPPSTHSQMHQLQKASRHSLFSTLCHHGDKQPQIASCHLNTPRIHSVSPIDYQGVAVDMIVHNYESRGTSRHVLFKKVIALSTCYRRSESRLRQGQAEPSGQLDLKDLKEEKKL
ncbi:hypothetical protein E1301_Tti015593 [Triplophysa tibetana]|uniref:Uncharacterized protein n=1 Tax=Triplophysa tibetana TaxID=1572043 RepID=A0A5A9NUI7_9TELE|nr:hypothetical protein E1301_Tti015593 [Triplophysa tibetana]